MVTLGADGKRACPRDGNRLGTVGDRAARPRRGGGGTPPRRGRGRRSGESGGALVVVDAASDTVVSGSCRSTETGRARCETRGSRRTARWSSSVSTVLIGVWQAGDGARRPLSQPAMPLATRWSRTVAASPWPCRTARSRCWRARPAPSGSPSAWSRRTSSSRSLRPKANWRACLADGRIYQLGRGRAAARKARSRSRAAPKGSMPPPRLGQSTTRFSRRTAVILILTEYASRGIWVFDPATGERVASVATCFCGSPVRPAVRPRTVIKCHRQRGAAQAVVIAEWNRAARRDEPVDQRPARRRPGLGRDPGWRLTRPAACSSSARQQGCMFAGVVGSAMRAEQPRFDCMFCRCDQSLLICQAPPAASRSVG